MNNQAMLEAMFDHATTGVLIVNRQGLILKANPFVSRLFGYENGEMLRLNVDDLLPSALKNAHKAHRDGFFKHPKSRAMGIGLALAGRRKDGTEFPVEISLGHTVVDGEPMVIAFVNDVSQMKQMINNLSVTNDKLDEVQALAHFGSFEWIVDGDKLTLSDELYRITGYEPQSYEPTFDNYYKCLHPEDLAYFKNRISDLESGGEDLNYEYRILRPDGDVRYVRGVRKTEYDKAGNLTRLYGLLQDVTEQRIQEATNRDISKIVEESLNEILIFDAETYKFVQANKGARLNIGYTIKELQVLTLVDLKPLYTMESFLKKMEPLTSKTSEELQFETIFERKNGTRYPVVVHLQRSSLNGAAVYVAMILDITERKKAQDALSQLNTQLEEKVKERTVALAQNQNRLKETNRIAKIGHWEMDFAQAGKVYWSEEYKSIYEVTEDIPNDDGRYFLQFCAKEDKAHVQKASKEAIINGKNVVLDYKIITALGNDKHVHSEIYCEKDEKGNVTKVFGILQDISVQKKSELQLHQSLSKERELNELKSRFVSMASHEFRTPLTSIMGSADILKIYGERKNFEKQEKHIKRIKSSVNNLTSILNDFLSLEKLESGKLIYNPEEINFCDFVDDVSEEVKIMAGPEQEVFKKHTGDQKVLIDPHLVKNILINLLSNAIKYSPKGEDVDVISEKTKGHLIINVKDRGIGIPEEDQKHMFTRFFRASNAINIKGTGLGLTIVQRYLELMDGTITFVSNSTDGTTFTIKIPQANQTE